MTTKDEELFALVKVVDPNAVRLPPGIKKIAEAIEAHEREACAKVCDTGNDSVVHPKYAEACRVSAALIRARSTQEKQE